MDDNLQFPDYREMYSVRLESFEGPLDLLLHLIKKNEVDIYNIPISEITRQYLEYIDVMKELNLEVAGEFLVIASTLIQIKSKMLLPPLEGEDDAEAEDAEDPRDELVKRLIEYQRYRDAAVRLEQRDIIGRDVFLKGAFEEIPEDDASELPTDLDIYQLVSAFQKLIAEIPESRLHEIGSDQYTLADRITEIVELLQNSASVTFSNLFPDSYNRDYIVITFLAVLELCRLKMVKVTQLSHVGEIWIINCAGQPGL